MTFHSKDTPEDVKDLRRCSTTDEINEVEILASDQFPRFTQTPRELGCLLPCHKTDYHTRWNHFPPAPSTNTHALANGSTREIMNMYVYYDTLTVEHQKEVLLYDAPAFLSSMGGTIGLYLGFSVLSVLIWIVNAVEEKYKKKKETSNEIFPKLKQMCAKDKGTSLSIIHMNGGGGGAAVMNRPPATKKAASSDKEVSDNLPREKLKIVSEKKKKVSQNVMKSGRPASIKSRSPSCPMLVTTTKHK